MLGVHSGVGGRLKKKFPALLLWHCLNHCLELAISDAVSSINGFYPIQAFFDKIYSVYSYSSKLHRQLCEISIDLDLQLKKIGKIFTVGSRHPIELSKLYGMTTQPSMSILKSFQKTCPLNLPNVQLTKELLRSYQQENLSRMWQSLKIAWLNYPCSQKLCKSNRSV